MRVIVIPKIFLAFKVALNNKYPPMNTIQVLRYPITFTVKDEVTLLNKKNEKLTKNAVMQLKNIHPYKNKICLDAKEFFNVTIFVAS